MKPTFVDDFTRPIVIDPASTALVIVDMQNATGSRNMGLGTVLARQGRTESAQYRFDRIDKVLVPNIRRLIDAFRAHDAKVVYVTYGSNVPDFSDMPPHMIRIVKETNNRVGQTEHEIVDALQPEPGDLVVNKTTQGAFGSTGIDSNLKAMGIETIVAVGVSTNNCVAMTAMEACDRHYGVVVVSDGTGTDSDDMQQATLQMLQRLWSRVLTTDEVIAELSGETKPGSQAATA
jgi:nicotinamidase-related amidase